MSSPILRQALPLTETQQRRALWRLCVFHIFIICASNYLVQLNFQIFGFETTWGTFSFPFIFLATDLTVRIFGAYLARRIIFVVMWPALLLSYVISVLWQDGVWQGWANLGVFNVFVARIALASFAAYIVGQFLDITVFNRLRRLQNWWVAPSASTILGNAIDTLVFFFVAFYRSPNAFMAQHWFEIAVLDYIVKITVCGVFFLPAYGMLLRFLSQKLAQNYTPQAQG
ncbi:7-cyano-7-deazaguanine/7-aminomethyl-7-deazaguanine transporter [Brackiella oedipodis]|uniref:7-cyano-7-deazaguanine/7-aminomethyl-7- deazaguanine transporter n=1 Tax=Brackiella oedipodis TaxID=124225 RepID=UPI000686B6E3|nr:7-cyano-7-deazaguanine/7-aminomethyl-7-deazaguanine transporter [Brackiella oedipodis]